MLRRIWIGALAVVTTIALVGCGGGGSTGAGALGNSYLFLTDGINTKYDHVWATVSKVDLVSATGQTVNVYNNTAAGGTVVDLRSLHGTAGQQYMLLSGFKTPAGSFTSANITVSSSLSIVPKGSTTAVSARFAGASSGSTVLSAKFNSPQNLATKPNVVVDFNLANWNLNGTTVSAPNNQFAQCSPPPNVIGPGNTVGSSYYGTVTNLSGTAPNLTFTIGSGLISPPIVGSVGPGVFNVVTSGSTVVSNSDGSANPTIADGESVSVTGTFDTTNNVLDATAITIQVGALPPPPAFVFGEVTADSLASNTITINVSASGGFQPSTTSLTVSVSPATTFTDLSGVTDTESQFFANLTSGTSNISVQGTISGSTMTATSIQLVPPMVTGGGGTGGSEVGSVPPIIQVSGPVSNISTSPFSFMMTLAFWTGGWQSPNTQISVLVNSNTQFFDGTGNAESLNAFSAGLMVPDTVTVRGTISSTPGVLTATSITLVPPNVTGKVHK